MRDVFLGRIWNDPMNLIGRGRWIKHVNIDPLEPENQIRFIVSQVDALTQDATTGIARDCHAVTGNVKFRFEIDDAGIDRNDACPSVHSR